MKNLTERALTYGQAMGEAIAQEMRRDETVILIGEDIRPGWAGVTTGLFAEFGERLINTPISEAAFVGAAAAAAATGLRPIVEMMFSDFMYVAMDQLANQTAKMRYMFGGRVKLPVVYSGAVGAGLGGAAQHQQTNYSVFLNIPGLKNVVPSTPADAKGLMTAAIREDNPVLFFGNLTLYRMKGTVPEGEYVIPLGEADVKREGNDVTLVALSRMVHIALSASDILEKNGISAEVIDPRSLVPLDKDTIIDSVKKTGRLIIVDESPITGSAASEITATVCEEAFDYLDAPIKRVNAPNTPVPFSPPLEKFYLPDEKKIIRAVNDLIG
jgi:pyruvate dehydrogenase E1 component beta subunit